MTTTYTYSDAAVSDSQIGHKKGITLQQGRALRDNPKGMAQGATDSPVIFAGWHPYNLTEVGGTETGVFYDFAVHGAQASAESPDFEDGFEYAFVFNGISSSAAATEFRMSLYRDTDAAYFTDAAIMASMSVSAEEVYGIIRVEWPRNEKRVHAARWIQTGHVFRTDSGAVTVSSGNDASFSDATFQTTSKARFRFDSGNIDAGTITMLRRREYLTG